MSGGYVPYHLRPNKAIDRATFIEFLQRVNLVNPIQNYTYIGFGGPFLEDFRAIHSNLGIDRLISIEEDNCVYLRQKFNKPFGGLDCKNATSSEFLASKYREKDQNFVIWLDFADPKKLDSQLEEFESTLHEMEPFDILKITLNANERTLGDPQYEKTASGEFKRANAAYKRAHRLHNLKSKVGSANFPDSITGDMLTASEYPTALIKILEKRAKRSKKGTCHFAWPALSFCYKDTFHQMLTLTCIILDESDSAELEQTQKAILDWSLSNTNWGRPRTINVPDLSAKERLTIDPMLPTATEEDILNKLGFELSSDRDNSLKMIESYKEYYRHYPYFSKVML
ncbi:MAG: hypothetical protein MK096_00685 [Oleiphilaceae bacterium]|nr:hypothetical protein [Oleiphilaceae bacterium]